MPFPDLESKVFFNEYQRASGEVDQNDEDSQFFSVMTKQDRGWPPFGPREADRKGLIWMQL